ncbi:hypothetical protein [Pontimicrobium sp. SW4]|uniref:Uncharacterized protein n=1 Tax=Pontimicrobium sp. SW4 TaxID=3153519 RepID=A0AAU7BWI0_9FLAO
MINKKGQESKFQFYLNWIKEHLSLLVLIPILLGGIWQVIMLWQFGLSYVRFFSISQLVSDGLIILMFVPLIILFSYFIFSYSIDKIRGKDKFEVKLKDYLPAVTLLIFLTSYSIHYITTRYGSSSLIPPFHSIIEFALISLGLYLSIRLNILFEVFTGKNEVLLKEARKLNPLSRIKNITNKNTFKIIGNFLMSLSTLGFFIFYFAFYFVVTINTILSINNYYKPNDLYNIKTVVEKVEKNYNIKKEDFEITYFNDSYIFITSYKLPKKKRDSLVQFKKVSKSEILILKTDAFFKELN